MLNEARSLEEIPKLAWNLPSLLLQRRGAGEPVLVLPGFGASDVSTAALRAYLSFLGYGVHGWGLGTNNGRVPAFVRRIIDLTARLADTSGQRVRLVGWSLGGVIARETARERPDLVERVITLGTPVIGGPRYTAVAGFYRRQGYDLNAVEELIRERNRNPIKVPITAIYSRSDGVVGWRACIDETSPEVEHVEVRTTHIGLGLHAEAYRLIATRLATPRTAA
jgi:esterase/lipase